MTSFLKNPWFLLANCWCLFLLTNLLLFKTTLQDQELVVQLLSCIWPWPHSLQHTRPPGQSLRSITKSRSLHKLMSIESMMPCNHFILRHPLLFLPSIFPSISVFSNESAFHIRWTKYWSFSFNISPSNEHSGLISFRSWLDLLALQGTLKSLLQTTV